jgi:two-component system, LuxR family, response regulator FixJ
MTPVRHAFIVDDEETVRTTLGRLLRALGIPSTGFSSAEAFLASYKGDEEGCLIVDIKMPGMSGLDLLDTLQWRGSTMPAIIISGHTDEGALKRLAGLRTLGLLEKPFSLAQLTKLLTRAGP